MGAGDILTPAFGESHKTGGTPQRFGEALYQKIHQRRETIDGRSVNGLKIFIAGVIFNDYWEKSGVLKRIITNSAFEPAVALFERKRAGESVDAFGRNMEHLKEIVTADIGEDAQAMI